jgi:hypothetical protein
MDISAALDLVANFMNSNPKLASFCVIAYTIGLMAKIGREAIEKFVVESPSKSDDEKLNKLKQNPAYKIFSMVLDFLFRLKKPEIK